MGRNKQANSVRDGYTKTMRKPLHKQCDIIMLLCIV